MAILYEVNLQVVKEIAQEYLSWLYEHLEEMLQVEGFSAYKLFQDISEPAGHTGYMNYVVQYTVADEEALQDYFRIQAPIMRQQGIDRFGDGFKAVRRVLKTL